MKLKDMYLLFMDECEGEDSLYNDVSWTARHYCPVSRLEPGCNVAFTPQHDGVPAIVCKNVLDDQIVLEYHNYKGPASQTTSVTTVVLTEEHPLWSTYSDLGGRYSNTYTLVLVSQKE